VRFGIYAGADSINVCSSDESSAMRLLIDVGSCLIMLGGWLEWTSMIWIIALHLVELILEC
jgi:hypothetical protein